MSVAILFALLFTHSPAAQNPRSGPGEPRALSAVLRGRVESYTLTAGDFVDALLEVGNKFEIPMGISCVRTDSLMKPVRLHWKGVTVQRVVEDIVRTQPLYEVNIKNAVVHIRPRGLVPRRENFLRLKVSQFEVENQVAELASRRLAQIVTLTVSPPKPPRGGQTTGGTLGSQLTETDDPEVSIRLRNATVEDVLDNISVGSPFKVWLVTFAGTGNVTPTGFRRTVSPLTGKAIPDEYQPTWELLRWGRQPY